MSAEAESVRLLPEAQAPARRATRAGTDAKVSYAAWLAPDVLLLMVTAPGAKAGEVDATAACGDGSIPVAARALPLSSLKDSDNRLGNLVAAQLRLPAGHTAADSLDLTVRFAGQPLRVTAEELRRVTVGLDKLLRLELAALDPAARGAALEFLVAGPGDDPKPKRGRGKVHECRATGTLPASARPGMQLSRSLHLVRQALRERLPQSVISVTDAQGLNVDGVLAIDEHNFYVQGWMRDEEAPPIRLTAVSPEGARTEILSRLYRYPRPDVEQFYGDHPDGRTLPRHGWIVHLETTAPSLLASGWVFELVNAAGSALEVTGPVVTRDLGAVREAILADLLREQLPDDDLRRQHIAPALTRLEERRRSLVTVKSVDQHGQAPAKPEVSIVVPLYGRVDFLEHQLAQFVHDPQMRDVDLIYVLDSPELGESFRVNAAQLAQLYDVPFRVAVMSHNAGFSGANNAGADLATGRLLLLLNSDVLPREPGWLSAMTSFYDSTPDIGVLAPKLIYEDESIQHAGLYFRRLVETGVWTNEHYFKGLHRSLPAANVARTVPAVTAACMMIDRTIYQELGGLRGMYIQGDYEDSDLCLRLREKGLDSWYLPSVELYHLEGQSYPSPMRELTGAYNRWLHTAKWAECLHASHAAGGEPRR